MFDKITEYLLSNRWIDCDCDYYISNDYNFKISLTYNSECNKYSVRVAILPIFDRWSNSGTSAQFNTQKEVIEYLKGAFIIDAFKEVRKMLENGLIQNNKEFDKDAYEDSYNLSSRIIEVVSEWFDEDKYT